MISLNLAFAGLIRKFCALAYSLTRNFTVTLFRCTLPQMTHVKRVSRSLLEGSFHGHKEGLQQKSQITMSKGSVSLKHGKCRNVYPSFITEFGIFQDNFHRLYLLYVIFDQICIL